MEWVRLISEHWPTLGAYATLLVGVFLAARYLRQSEMTDMRERVEYLDSQVRALRYRDECYFDYVLFIEGFNREAIMLAKSKGCDPSPPMPFMAYRDKWMKERGLQDKLDEIWR